MRAVGIREIKNKLSEYIGHVRRGETVLVTDRGQVVAQLAPLPTFAPPTVTEAEALARLAAAGKVQLPSGSSTSREPGGPIRDLEGMTYREDLEAARDERF